MSPSKRKAGKTKNSGSSKDFQAHGKNQAPPEGFGDFMDLAAEQDVTPAVQPVPVVAVKETQQAKPELIPGDDSMARIWQKTPENKTPTWAWGMLPAACALVVGVALSSALVFLFKGDPARIWDFSGLSSLDTIYDLNVYPQHVLFAVLASSVLLLAMVGYRMGSVIGDLKSRVKAQDELLGRLTSLRLENEDAWNHPLFKMKPGVEAFTIEVMAAWRQHEARLQRVVGLEGELHRLEKALSEDSREDLNGKFEVPVVGMIVDEVVQLYEARNVAQEELDGWKAKLGSKGHEVMSEMQDARGWQRFTQDQLNLQEDAVKKASSHLAVMSSQMEDDPRYQWDPTVLNDLLTEIHEHLRGSIPASSNGSRPGATGTELLDRLTKLSFQIGMEVARLGGRGERLGPMTQTLEELARALRHQGTSGQGGATVMPALPEQILERLEKQMARLAAATERPAGNITELARKLSKATGDVAENLGKIAKSFEHQYERLGKMGQINSELTGIEFDHSPAAAETNQDLQLRHFDPFLKGEPEQDVPLIDPFMEPEEMITDQGNAVDPFEVTTNILPGEADDFARSSDPVFGSDVSDTPAKVYDLNEFGAVKIDSTGTGESADDIIYDLAEFGAKLISNTQQEAVGDDRVYDLSEFGARRLK